MLLLITFTADSGGISSFSIRFATVSSYAFGLGASPERSYFLTGVLWSSNLYSLNLIVVVPSPSLSKEVRFEPELLPDKSAAFLLAFFFENKEEPFFVPSSL
ncbi:MAG: hypothetical protein LBL93_05205 [Ruminococcus sp.]|nr:hypothetical protein [Ruminococcus sp.]